MAAREKPARRKKNAPGQGRKPRDKRGKTERYTVHLVPIQMVKLRRLVKRQKFRNLSRMLAAMADEYKG